MTERDEDGFIFIYQNGYVTDALSKCIMQHANPVLTPVEKGLVTEEKTNVPCSTAVPYREVVGCLMQTSVATRPGVNYLLQFVNKPC